MDVRLRDMVKQHSSAATVVTLPRKQSQPMVEKLGVQLIVVAGSKADSVADKTVMGADSAVQADAVAYIGLQDGVAANSTVSAANAKVEPQVDAVLDAPADESVVVQLRITIGTGASSDTPTGNQPARLAILLDAHKAGLELDSAQLLSETFMGEA
jgi:hypothetical protein